MARKKLNVEKRPIRFYKGDIDLIQEHFPDIPYNAIIRELIHIYAQNLSRGQNNPLVYDPNQINFSPEQTS